MSMIRWQPFNELISLRQAMDRLFEDSFVTPSRFLNTFGPRGTTPIDMYHTANEVVVKAALPGIKPRVPLKARSNVILQVKPLSQPLSGFSPPSPGQKYPETGAVSWQLPPRLPFPDSDKSMR
ncbi:MAG: hypothetical protein ISS51_02785 [Dehalococcoidales bacterium]|nr:hypothetical protein [Dehalococcoidales bacterium]